MSFKIGIIGGASPTAGIDLFQKLISVCQKKYGCKEDGDFPHVMMISYPFTDMLGENIDERLIAQELQDCLDSLAGYGVDVAAIACNTLHAFLPFIDHKVELIHIIEEIRSFLERKKWKNPLVLCSSTSVRTKIHARYFDCHYPDRSIQNKIDALINAVTAGCCLEEASCYLSSLVPEEQTVILGCTELSVIHENEPLLLENVCNPTEIIVERMCELCFCPAGI